MALGFLEMSESHLRPATAKIGLRPVVPGFPLTAIPSILRQTIPGAGHRLLKYSFSTFSPPTKTGTWTETGMDTFTGTGITGHHRNGLHGAPC